MPQNWPPVVFLGLLCRLGAEGLEAQRAGGLQDAHGVTLCHLHPSPVSASPTHWALKPFIKHMRKRPYLKHCYVEGMRYGRMNVGCLTGTGVLPFTLHV